MIRPIDAITTVVWGEPDELADNAELDLHRAFADDPERAARFTYIVEDLHVDLSKNLTNDDVVMVLLRFAGQTDVIGRRDVMFRGEHINAIGDRAVLRTALRLPRDVELTIDGQDAVADIHEVLDKMFTFADKVRSGEWVGVMGKPIHTAISIGIGGSDLGPVMVHEAPLPHKQQGLECRFISNIDSTDCSVKTADLDPETMLFVVAFKTSTTLETLTNARMARAQLLDALVTRGTIEDTEQAHREVIAKHFVAISTVLDRVAEFGIDPVNAFGFWNWVDDRYSVDSVVGLPVVTAIGPDGFRDLLAGFCATDQHFRIAEPAHNVSLLMGLLNAWYVNSLNVISHAMLPYTQYLHQSAAYPQQLMMESNGKSVRWDGSLVTCETGEVFWGEPGINDQHTFYQLIHQGAQLIFTDLVVVVNPPHTIRDGDVDVHGMFPANFFAQTTALTLGKTEEQVCEEGIPEEIVPARIFFRSRLTTSVLAPVLTPSMMGQLVTFYEHITFTQGIMWGTDFFNQWGVKLGKKLILEIAPAVFGDTHALTRQDASTWALVP